MKSIRDTGRVVGVLTLIQLSIGMVVPMVLVSPLHRPPGILANAAEHPLQVALAVVLSLAAGLLGLGIAIVIHSLVRGQALGYGLWLVVLAAVSLAMISRTWAAVRRRVI